MKDSREILVTVKDIHKTFKLPHDQRKSLKQTLLSFKKISYEQQRVLNGVSLEVRKGEFFGILGRNGSGKSTLLKLLANIYEPTSGSIEINGNLTPFIELGIGFNTELSGKDNVFLNGAILGLTKKEIDEKYDEIVAFAELEKFMDQKLRNYSSGMLVRLAFAIAIQAHNEILLIDEVLAVGDINFQQKCLNVFRDLKKTGKTVILVTHDMGAVEEFCDRAVLINDGEVIASGGAKEIANSYRQLNFEQFANNDNNKKKTRWGLGGATIQKASVEGLGRAKGKLLAGEKLTVTTNVSFEENLEDVLVGIQIIDMAGNIIIGTNTMLQDYSKRNFKKNEIVSLEWTLDNILKSGKYSLAVAVHSYGGEPYDWWDNAFDFTVQKTHETSALTDVDITLKASLKGKDKLK